MPAHEERDDDRYFDLDGLARYSSLSVSSLRRYLTDPEHPLPHRHVRPAGKTRGRVLVSKRAFDRWLDEFESAEQDDPADVSWIRRRRR